MKKLAILTTHPIQYHAPLFRMLAAQPGVQLKVFYSRRPEQVAYDKGFQQEVQWDIPLLEGYDHQFTSQDRITRILEIEAFAPDAVLVFGWSPPGHLNVLRHFKDKIPVWFRGDSTLLDEKPGLRQWARRRFLRWVYRHIDLAFYVGSANKAYFLAHGVEESQLVFAPHAVDNERFGLSNDIRVSQWREELGIRHSDIAILFAGKLEPKKQPDLLLEAVMQYNASGSVPIHLIFAGNGILEDQLKIKAADSTHIHFLGFQNQSRMPHVYRLGDIVCLPSAYNETWGLAVNEAMACGRPVLVSDRCGCAINLVRDGKNGYVFISGDLQDLTEKIEMLHRNKGSLANMGQQSVEIIQQWSFEQICAAIVPQLQLLQQK